MTAASFYLSRTGTICLVRPSHTDAVRLRFTDPAGAVPLLSSPLRNAARMPPPLCTKQRSDELHTSVPSFLLHWGSLNPHSLTAVRAV
jgi:hypothetical protein